jgi:hypothetical protein
VGGCAGGDVEVEVHAVSEIGGPLAELEVRALPFDPDRILDSLGRVALAPRPRFHTLESEMAVYRRPSTEALESLGVEWRTTYDSVVRLADSLRSVSSQSAGYATAYDGLRRLYQRLAQRASDRDAEFQERIGDDRELAVRAGAAADTLRAWEREAYAAFPALADSAVARSGRPPRQARTDAGGHLVLTLEPGSWWLIARREKPENPFIEYYWKVGIVLSPVGPKAVPILPDNRVTRWRH